MKRKVLIVTSLLMSVMFTYAQRPELGLFAGGSYYNGDINPGQLFSNTNAGYGLVFRYNLDTRLALNLSAFRGDIGADESVHAIRPLRNAVFSGTVNDVSLTGEFNFLKFFIGSSKHKASPYLFGGLGYYFYSGDYTALETGGSYSGNGFSVPFGLGAKFSVTKTLGLALEWGYRKTFNDGLDGLQEYYPVDEGSNLYGVQMSNAATNDWYSFAGVSITLDLSVFQEEECRDMQRNY